MKRLATLAAVLALALFARQADAAWPIYVIDGRADKLFAEQGEWVYIDARSAWPDESFDRWSSSEADVYFQNIFSMQTRFRMPDHSVTIRALYDSDRRTALVIGGGCSTGALAAIAVLVTAICTRRPARSSRRLPRARR